MTTGDGNDDDKPDDMMGATAIAVNTVDQNIAAHSSQATAFQFVEQNYL